MEREQFEYLLGEEIYDIDFEETTPRAEYDENERWGDANLGFDSAEQVRVMEIQIYDHKTNTIKTIDINGNDPFELNDNEMGWEDPLDFSNIETEFDPLDFEAAITELDDLDFDNEGSGA